MAAEREEVVVRADVRHPQHLGEECAQRLLARPGRSAVRSGSGRVRCRRWRGVQLLARFPGGSCPCGGRAAGYGGAACGGQGRSVVGGAGTVMRAAWPGGRPGRVPRNTGSYVRVRIRNSRTAMGDTRAGRARGRETPGRRPREDARVPGRRQPERFGERGAVLDFRCAGAVGRGPLRLTRAISQSPVDMHTACIRSGQPMPDRISCESTSHPGRRQGRSSPHPVKSRTPSGRPAGGISAGTDNGVRAAPITAVTVGVVRTPGPLPRPGDRAVRRCQFTRPPLPGRRPAASRRRWLRSVPAVRDSTCACARRESPGIRRPR